MPDTLYDRDALAWADQQAALLRRLAAGEQVADLDWPNIIEEVQHVGLSELHACRSLLCKTLVHLLKLHAFPDSPAAAHWRGEVIGFLADAQTRYTPTMHQRIDLADLYADALHIVRAAMTAADTPKLFPKSCPLTLDNLTHERTNLATLLRPLSTNE